MVQYVIDALSDVDVDRVVIVVGEGAEQVTKKLSESAADPRLVFAEQRSQRGSAETALVGLEVFADDFGDDDLIVLSGNTPLLSPGLIRALLDHHRDVGAAATVLGVPADPHSGLGRLVPAKADDCVDRVASPTDFFDLDWLADGGVYCFRRAMLAPAIRRLQPDPQTGAYLLADVVEVLTEAGHRVAMHVVADAVDVQPVDDRVQLAAAEGVIRERTNRAWMRRGVTMVDPAQTYVDTTVELAVDVTLFPGTMLQGATVIGAGAEVGPDTRLVDCAVGHHARVEKTMSRDAEIGEYAHVGPFAVLEPGAQVPAGAVTGPFYHATQHE